MTERTITYRLRAVTSGLTTPLKQAGTQVNTFGKEYDRNMSKVSGSVTKAGLVMGAFGAGTAMALKNAVDASISFESAFAGVRKTVKASEAEFARMQADIRQLAKDIPVTVEELSGIGEAAGQLGISTEHLMGFTRVMADLGASTNMSSEEAATSLARLANITQMPQEEFDRLGSTVVSLGNNLATTEGEIVAMGLRLAGAGNQVGMTEAQILGLGGALSSVGIEAEAGGSAISKVMIEIASQVENGGDKLAIFARTAGMSAEEFSAAYEDDATEAIIRFVEGLGNMEAQGGSTLGVLEELGIEEVRMRDALLRTSGAGDQLRQAIELANGAWEENIALTVEAEQRYGTTESQLAMASNRINDMKIALGDTLAPAFLGAANAVASVAERFSDLSPEAQKATGLIAGATSGVALLGGASLIAIPRIAALNATLAASGGILGTWRAGMASTARFMVGPWGVALGAASAGLMTFNRHQHDAARFAEMLHEELADTPGELSHLSDAFLVSVLRSKDVMGAWRDTGLELSVLRSALEGNADAAALIDAEFDNLLDPIDALKTALPGLRDEKRDLAHTIHDLKEGTADYNREAAWTEALMAGSGAGVFYTELERGTEVTDEMRAAAAAAGIDVGTLTDALGGAGEETEELTDKQKQLQESLLSWPDVGAVHSDVMSATEEAERDRAQTVADSKNEVIDAQIRELDSTKSTYEEERAALEGSKTSWEDHAVSVQASLADTAAALEAQNTAYAEWETNLVKVAGRAGSDVATILAGMGEAGVTLTAQMATGTDTEVQRMASALRTHSQRGGEGVVTNLETAMGLAEGAMSSGGTKSANALARELGIGVGKVLEVAKAYGIALAEGINPVLVGIGSEKIAVSSIHAIALSNILGTGPMGVPATQDILGRNMGGRIPGSGPDRDSVLIHATPEEYVTRRPIVREQGVDKFDLLNAGLADIVPRFNTGGRVTGDIAGLNLEFLGRIQRWAGALGDTYHVTSGYRSIEEQARLYAMYRAGTGNLAAPPGRSRHNFGLAADGPRWGNRGPGRFGMHYNVGGEPWHVEPVDAAALMGGAAAASSVPGVSVKLPKPPDFPHNGIMGSADTAMGKLHQVVQAFADANTLAPAMQTGGAVPASGSVQEMARELLNNRGWGGQWAAFDTLVRKESSWNPNAQNPTSTAYGLGQFLNSTWATVGGSKTSDPALQLEYMMRYIAQRYGDPASALRFHLANNWYNKGGVVGMAHGGIISERVDGVGASGQRYAFGENGPERVTPLNAGGLVGMPAAPTFTGSSLRLDPDEYGRRVAVNNRLFELGIISLSDHLENLERRMLRTVPFSDEWMSLFTDRQRLVDDLLEEHMRSVDEAQRHQDEAFEDLNRLLDERNRITEQIEDEQARYIDEGTKILERRNEERLRIEQRFNDERERIIRARSESLVSALPMEERAATQWANSISAILRNEMERATQREDWAEGLDLLRGMGLSEDAIETFGLGDLTEESLAKVRLWSQSTEAEIAALNAAVAERQRFAGDQAATEGERLLGTVGEELVALTERTAEELQEVQDDYLESWGTLRESVSERITELNADLAGLGEDAGRSWSEAMAEGIESGIPAIVAAVQAARAAQMATLHAGTDLERAREQAAANPPAGQSASIAPLGRHYVLPDGRHMLRLSDQSWYQATGPGQIRELHRLYGAPTEHPGIESDRILGSLVSLFGAGGMEAFTRAQVQPKYFDQGGWLAPNSVTLAANATSRWEPVGQTTHAGGLDRANDKVVAAINRQTQVIERGIEQGQVIVLDRETLDGISDHAQARLADQGDTARLRQRRGRAGVR